MNKTLDLNKASKAQKARKAWKQLQEEKELNRSEINSNQGSSEETTNSQPTIRKSS